MNISYHNNYYYRKTIHVKDDNASIDLDVEHREYEREPVLRCVLRDVSDEAMDEVSRLLSNMASDRIRNYDSSGCIRELFEKLPADVRSGLLKELTDLYVEEESNG